MSRKRRREKRRWEGDWWIPDVGWTPPLAWRSNAPLCGHARHDWSWVEGSLATGGMPATKADVDALVAAGITHVVNVATEDARRAETLMGDDPRITYLHNPSPDDGQLKSAEWFGVTVGFTIAAIENGDRVLVHCHCGSNRGPSSAYAVLLAMGHAPEAAEALIRAARPQARLLYLPDALAAVCAA